MYNFWWCYFGCEGTTFDVFVGLQVQRQDSHHANSAEPAKWGVGALHVWVGQDGAAQGRWQQRHLPLHPALLFHTPRWTPPPPASLCFSDWPVRPRAEQLRLTQLAVTYLLFTRLLDCWSVCSLPSGMAVVCENEVYMAMKLTFGGEGGKFPHGYNMMSKLWCLTGVVITFYISNMISKHWCLTGAAITFYISNMISKHWCLTGAVITFYISNMISKHWCLTGVAITFHMHNRINEHKIVSLPCCRPSHGDRQCCCTHHHWHVGRALNSSRGCLPCWSGIQGSWSHHGARGCGACSVLSASCTCLEPIRGKLCPQTSSR